MKIEILTLFPEIFSGFLSSSLIAKACSKGLLQISTLQIRDFADPPHYHVDDTPYGGGAGMLMKPEPLSLAIESAQKKLPQASVILLSASGKAFNQSKAKELSQSPELILICGRYEGVDQRVIDLFVDEELSIGDYVLMGGEVAAMTIIEASARLIPQVLGNQESILNESFSDQTGTGSLEAPHYTRPAEFRGLQVPEVLLSGNHAQIEKWRNEASQTLTRRRRAAIVKKS